MTYKEFVRYMTSVIKKKFNSSEVFVDNDTVYIKDRFHIPLSSLFVPEELQGDDFKKRSSLFLEELTKMTLPSSILENVKNFILPRIMKKTPLIETKTVNLDWLDSFLIVFFLDYPHGLVSVREEDFKSWGIDRNDVFDIAINNFNNTFEAVNPQMVNSDVGNFICLTEPVGYASSCILSQIVKDRVASLLNIKTFYCSIPNRDICLFFDPSSVDIKNFQKSMKKNYDKSQYAIADTFFNCVRDGVLPAVA